MRLLEPFKSYLPSDVGLTDEKVDGFYLAKVFSEQKLIGQALDRDSRTASLSAIGSALADYWPQREPEGEKHLTWAFGISTESARQRAMTKAVRRWAWAMWMSKSLPVSPQDALVSELSQLNLVDAGWVKQMTYWQAPLSFFEPESGIHHLKFTVATCQTELGWLIASAVVRTSESPIVPLWEDFLFHLAILRDSGQVKTSSELKQRLMAVRGVDLKAALTAWQAEGEWPPFRLDQSFAVPLGKVGNLWAARVEGFGDAMANCGTLFLCE